MRTRGVTNWTEHEAAEQGDEADEAKHIGASQLIPGVRPTRGYREEGRGA
jgi:hypothetical protein